MRQEGRPTAAYTGHAAAGCVLVVVNLGHDGWRSVTNDAGCIVADLAELQPDLLTCVPLIAHQDSLVCWNALCIAARPGDHRRRGCGLGFVALDAKTFLGGLKLAPPCNASTHAVF